MFAKLKLWVSTAFKSLLLSVLIIVLAFLAYLSVNGGFGSLKELRQLERTPRSLVAAVLPGEVNVQGVARQGSPLLQAPETGTPAIYYRHHIEREERDSDGDKSWRTVSDRRVAVEHFLLEDDSGQIKVIPTSGQPMRAEQRFQRRAGDMRYTEYRIDPGDDLFIFGYAAEDRSGLHIGFGNSGQYTPIISMFGESRARSGMAAGSLWLIWLGTVLSSVAVFLVCWLFRVHLSVVYLGLLCMVTMLGMIHLANSMARADLRSSYERTVRDLNTAGERLQSRLAAAGARWNGDWEQHLDLADQIATARLSSEDKRVLSHLRERMLIQVSETERIRRHWPERAVARGLNLPTLPELGSLTDAISDATDMVRSGTHVSGFWAGLLGLLGLVLSAVFAKLGFSRIKVKRLIEDLPTSRSAGVAYGLAELVGTVEAVPGEPDLEGPLTQRPCVWFRYLVQERRGSGKNARWVTLEDRSSDRRFCIRDSEGVFPVIPAEAEIIVNDVTVRREGRIRRSEYVFAPGTELYALGSAEIDPQTQSTLVLQRGPKELPYILTDISERELMVRKARTGFILLNVSVNGGNAMALATMGGMGAMHGLGFLTASLVPVAYLGLFLAILMYNNLITLRLRVRRAWANIQVSLAKRSELVPNLEQVLKAYMGHERGLQQNLAEMRSLSGQYNPDPQIAGQLMVLEQALLGRMSMLREAYPELKANTVVTQLMRQIVALENEVALMREGYNNSVERYNTRRLQVPEVVFTKLFTFEPEEFFRADIAVHTLPKLNLEAKPTEEAAEVSGSTA